MITVTFTDALILAIKTAAEKPRGYTYTKLQDQTSCMYVHPDENGKYTVPACFIGTAFLDAGICTVNDFIRPNGNQSSTNQADAHILMETLEKQGTHKFSNKAKYFLRAIQRAQDTGHTWDSALEQAIRDWASSSMDDTV